MNTLKNIPYFLFATLLWSCQSEQKAPPIDPLFEVLKKEQTGLDFENHLEQSMEFNAFRYMYFYNGGGVAGGDYNGDGLIDLYFTSNMGANKLFLNQGEMKFKDITKTSGTEGLIGWTTGASVVDINSDGKLDIYVNNMGELDSIKGHNQLFINLGNDENGIPKFEDQSVEYGLDLRCFSTHSLFFDYDLDGDLDMFQLNHSLHANGTFGQKKNFVGKKHDETGDKLLENRNGKFVEVTEQAGINSTVIGYGLGVVAGDINNDGFPDLYVGNDFHENDYLYINNGNGTFSEVLTEQMRHTSRFSMGVDIGDINNDGWSDIMSMDMLPSDPFILKTSLAEDGFDIFSFKLRYGYNHQFARNNLQLNLGNGNFSEIGLFADVFATDWSWATLFSDFDHDGFKDIFVSNGIPRRMNDIDYINYRTSDPDIKWKTNTNMLEKDDDILIIDKMPQIKLPNVFFKNGGNLKFEDISAAVIGNPDTYSNGAISVDLDNDGDLDFVTNNIEDEPFIYKNLLQEKQQQKGDFLSLSLNGSEKNPNAVGTQVKIYKSDGSLITAEHYPVRGFQSSVMAPLHIGVGNSTKVDSILLIWTDRTYQKIAQPEFNNTTSVKWQQGLPPFPFGKYLPTATPLANFESTKNQIDFTHKENPFVEFNREKLIPRSVATESPALAVGDVNRDGLEDVFFGNSKRKVSGLYLQQRDGSFSLSENELIKKDALHEDVDAVFEDIENDGDLDLVIATGGNEFTGTHESLQPKIYLNDGTGNFTEKYVFSDAHLTASCVLPADFNKDGLVDFFFGGRAVQWNYGHIPNSYLFENQGNGQFKQVQPKELNQVGLVKDGTWADYDQDGDEDLILALDWAPVIIFENQGNTFLRKEINDLKGWWNMVEAADFDGDGDIDFLAGNMGQNSKLKPTAAEPVRMYVNDFDDNKQVEQILTYYLDGKEIPFATYAELTKQLVSLKKKYLLSKDFAKASLNELFGKQKLKESVQHEANECRSFYFENDGSGNFKAHPLPTQLQLAPIESAAIFDKTENSTSVIIGGNFYEPNIEMGRYDASYGNLLKIEKDGKMNSTLIGDLPVKGQVRRIEPIQVNGKPHFILAKNNDKPQLIRQKDE